MAGNGSLRGQARRSRQQLTALHQGVAGALTTHIKVCAICTRARNDVFKRCDYGWSLTKLELRHKRAIERYDNDHPDQQERFF